jgi:putative ABC transport system permease protein
VRALTPDIEAVARLDLSMLAMCFALALVTSVLAGVYPAWRACNVAPAAQLKTN